MRRDHADILTPAVALLEKVEALACWQSYLALEEALAQADGRTKAGVSAGAGYGKVETALARFVGAVCCFGLA
jgi:hypothetical protein